VSVLRDTLDLVARIAPRIISATRRCQAVAVNSATAITIRTYVAPETAIRTPVIASNVCSTLTVPLAKCAKRDSMETLCDRIVKTVDVTSWAPTRPQDRAIIVPDNVHVCHMS